MGFTDLPGNRFAAALTMLGGVLAVAAGFLSWARVVTDDASTSVRGISSGPGTAALVIGVVLLLVGRGLRRTNAMAGRGRGLLAAALGLAVVGLAVNVLATHDRQIEAGIRDRLQATGEAGTTEVREAHADLVRHGLEATFGPGVYLALAGGLLAVVGGSATAGRSNAARRSITFVHPATVATEPAAPGGPETPAESE